MKAWSKNLHLRYKKAFTLAELMIILLVISLVMAAFAPVMTSRSRQTGGSGTDPWTAIATTTPNDLYFGSPTTTEGAAIGASNIGTQSTELLLNTDTSASSTTKNHILFKQANATTGRMTVDSSGNIGLGYVNFDTAFPLAAGTTGAIAIGGVHSGFGATANKNYAIAIGAGGTYAGGNNSIAIGDSMPLGPYTEALGDNSIAIGSYATATKYGNIALGLGCNATGIQSIALGSVDSTGLNSIAVGSDKNGVNGFASSDYSIAMGKYARVAGNYGIAIGGESFASSPYAIAIGDNAIASGNGIAIGADTDSSAALNVISIGNNNLMGVNKGIALGQGYAGVHGVAINGSAVNNGITIYDITIGYPNLGGIQNIFIPEVLILSGNSELILGDWPSGTDYIYWAGKLWGGSDIGNLGDVGKEVTNKSDRRLKNVKNEFTDGINKIKQLKTYNYTFKIDVFKKPQVGIMAQDLQKIFPTAVKKDKKGYLCIRKDEMGYAMLNAIKQIDKATQNLIKGFNSLIEKVQLLDSKAIALLKVNQTHIKSLKEIEFQDNSFDSRITRLEKTLSNKAK